MLLSASSGWSKATGASEPDLCALFGRWGTVLEKQLLNQGGEGWTPEQGRCGVRAEPHGKGFKGKVHGPNGELLVEKLKRNQLPGAQIQRNKRLRQLKAPDSVWSVAAGGFVGPGGLNLQEKGLEFLPYDGKGAALNRGLL